MLKVTHVSGGTLTGCTRVVLNLLRHHDRAIIEPSVCFFGIVDAAAAVTSEVEAIGVRWKSVVKHQRYDVGSTVRLALALRELDPDLVVLHGFGAYSFGTLAAKLARRTPIVRVEHHPELYSPLYRRVSKVATRWNDSTIMVSKYIESYLAENHIHPKHGEVIYNGIDLEQFLRIDKPVFQNPVPTLLMAARMDVSKDHSTLLKAVAMLRDRQVALKLRLSHSGPFEQQLRKQVSELRIDDRVEFIGHCPSMPALLADTDIAVLSTHCEGFGLVVVEAMASGRPVVATRITAVPELFESGTHGFLVAHESPTELADALMALIRDPARAKEMGQAGRKHAAERFAIVPSVRAYERHFMRLRAGSSQGPVG